MKDYIEPPSTLPAGSVVWAYLRDSGGDAQEQSVPQQRAEVEAYCRRHALGLGIVFADVAKSGGSVAGRDNFNDMIDLSLDEGMRPAGLLIWNLARFSRDLDDSSYYKAVLRKRGIVVHSLTDPIPEGEFGRLVEVLIDIANQERCRQISRDVKRALAALVRQGYAPGGFPPRGYQAEPVTIGQRRDGSLRVVNRWVPDPELWDLVKLAWSMRAQGKTYKEIQEATGRKIYKSDSCWVTHFSNKCFLGVGRCGDLEIEDHHPAAVDLETWERVQAIQRNSYRFGLAANPASHPRRIGLPSLLSGLAVCIYCGSSINYHFDAGKWPSYTCCKKGNQGFQSCEGRKIGAVKADTAIIDRLFSRVLTIDYMRELMEETRAILNDHTTIDREIELLKGQQVENEKKIKNLLDTAEAFGPEAVRDRLPGRLAERARLAVELRAWDVKQRAAVGLELSPEAFELVVESWRSQILEALAGQDVRKLKELLRQFIARLELGYNIANVTWTFPVYELVIPYTSTGGSRLGVLFI
jgi:DNA invertase Pin-like site-specific DNA recombinase